jgi:hypothetical protein
LKGLAVGSYKGQPTNNPAGNPECELHRNKRGSKPGVPRGPYRKKTRVENAVRYQKVLEEMHPTSPPKLRAVEDKVESMDCLDLTQAVIDNPAIPIRDKLAAAAIQAPYKHAKQTSKVLSNRINLPVPQNAADARTQIGLILQMVRQQMLTVEEGEKQIAMLQAFITADNDADFGPRLERLEARYQNQGAPIIDAEVVSDMPALPLGENDAPIIMPGTPEWKAKYGLADQQKPPESAGEAGAGGGAKSADTGRSEEG